MLQSKIQFEAMRTMMYNELSAKIDQPSFQEEQP